MRALLVLALCGVGTYLLRASLLVSLGRAGVPRLIRRGNRFIAPAVMAAIIAPAVVAPRGRVDLLDLRVAAVAAAALVALKTRSLIATLVTGLGGYVVVDLLL